MERRRRVGAIGDLHCQDERLELALDALVARGADTIVQLGDIVDGPGDLERCIRLMREREVIAIAGNHERWFLSGEMRGLRDATMEASDEVRAYLAALPRTRRIATVAGEALLCHGVAEDDMAMFEEHTRGYALQSMMPLLRGMMEDPRLQFMLGGHTHHRMVRAMPGFVALNAGTLADNGPPGFLLIDFEARTIECIDLKDGEVVDAGVLPLPDPLPL